MRFRWGVCRLVGDRKLDIGEFLVTFDREGYKTDLVVARRTISSFVETVRL